MGNNKKEIFSSIAAKYDLTNKILSFGLINYWRRKIIGQIEPVKRGKILDLCTGTGEVARMLACKFPEMDIYGLDFCPQMISEAQKKKQFKNIKYIVGDACNLVFPDQRFDYVVVVFGLRNVDKLELTLRESKRVLKKGGKLISLDLGYPEGFLFKKIYYLYFDKMVPFLGGLLQGDRKPYQYLVKSVKNFPEPEMLKCLLLEEKYKNVKFYRLTGGICVLHIGVND